MKPEPSKAITRQKKITRGLKGVIVALLAIIGILKISIGGVINVPIAYLFGDLFIAVFSFLAVFSFYLMVFPFPKGRSRNTYVFLAVIGLLMLASGFYAGHLRNFGTDGTKFSDNLAAMSLLARENFSFTAAKDHYWYNYGGLVGEGLIYLFAPLGKGLIIALFTIFSVGLLVLIFWPLLVKLSKIIKEYIRDKKKRRRVLNEAGVLHHEQPKDLPTQVRLDELMEEERVVNENPLLKRVGHEPVLEENIKVVEEVVVAKPTTGPSPIKMSDDAFVLPTLDTEEKIEAIQTTGSFNKPLQKVDNDNFESLQKALDTSGSIESITFDNPETKKAAAEISAFEVEPSVVAPAELAPEVKEVSSPLPVPKKEPVKLKTSYANFRLPSIDLLDGPVDSGQSEENRIIAADFEGRINAFFTDFGIGARVTAWTIGSSFTRYEIQLDATESLKSITPHMNDISLRLNGAAVRFEPIIPGKATSGLEVANTHRTIVNFKECMQTVLKHKKKNKYIIPLGKDVAGNVISAPFSDFPHLLVAGSTGSGKSVFIHTVLTSLILLHNPDELRLLLIDPKRVELAQYANIPHLLTPIIKEPSESKVALDRLIDEMEKRYKLFEKTGVSKVSDYNELAEENGEPPLPLIIAIVDEFADLFESEKEVSTLVLRLVQKSRAAGIHLLIATQRPSVQVITGNIKANIPSRVAFMTASVTDSMTILGQGGAETLLGYGDMLVDSLAIHNRGFLRVQAPFIPIKEVNRITNYLRTNYMTSFYDEFLDLKEKVTYYGTNSTGQTDDLYPAVVEFVSDQDTISISKIQQFFGVGYPRARSLYDALMEDEVIAPPDEANSAKGAVVLKNKR